MTGAARSADVVFIAIFFEIIKDTPDIRLRLLVGWNAMVVTEDGIFAGVVCGENKG